MSSQAAETARRRALVLAGFAAVGLLGVGCGSSSPSATASPTATATPAPPTPSPTPDLAALGQEFLSLRAPYRADLVTLNNHMDAGIASNKALAACTAPVATALDQFDSSLLTLPWPAEILPDSHALVTADGALLGDLENAMNETNFTTWLSQLQADLSKAGSPLQILTADLDLPAPSPLPSPIPNHHPC